MLKETKMYGKGSLTTGSPQLVTQLNTAAVVDLIRRAGPISRVDIAQQLGLSPATISRLIGELLTTQIVQEYDRGESRGGRRPVLLSYNPRAAFLIGVDIGGTKIAAALSDLDGHIFVKEVRPTWPTDQSPGGLEGLYAILADLLATQRELAVPILGIGVGVPGVLRQRDGVVRWSPGLRWRDLPLADLLQERFGLPVFLENDVNLAALGEHWRGAGQGIDQLVGCFIGTGIGAGIILNGQLFHGAQEAAGEIGYFLLDRSDLQATYPGFGAFETTVAGPGIAQRAQQQLLAAPATSSSLRSITPLTSRVVLAAAPTDQIARQVVDETLDYLALALGNVACVLNPQRIILGGAVGLALARWYPNLQERLTGRIPHVPELVSAALGNDAGLLGAIALAREQTYASQLALSQLTETALR